LGRRGAGGRGGGHAEFPDLQTRTLADQWDGTSWQLQTTPVPANTPTAYYDGVACTSATACTAVGSAAGDGGLTMVLAATWQGTSWQTQATPDPAGAAAHTILDGVSCVSASACEAVGYFDTNANVGVPLAEIWNGTSWKIQPTPNPATLGSGFLGGVSCTSASACTAVGSYLNTSTNQNVTLAERWDGTSWQIQPTPNPANATNGSVLGAVSCSAPDACTAVGQYTTPDTFLPFAEAWNGTTWTVQTTPFKGGSAGYLDGVSCASPGDCVAVGDLGHSDIWNGTAWQYQRIALPANSRAVVLTSVSCASASACTAVGSYGLKTGAGGSQTLGEAWNGAQWALQTTASQAKAKFSQLDGVSCSSADACTAVGVYQHTGVPPQFALAETWSGTAWTLDTLPAPAHAEASLLFGVSCLASGCTAGGAYIVYPSGIQLSLALHASS
jgi:hypothetical protein